MIESIYVNAHCVWFIKHFEISLALRPGIAVTIILAKFENSLKMYREITGYLLQWKTDFTNNINAHNLNIWLL